MNTATIIGNLTRDPIVKQVGANATELADFGVAVKGTAKRGSTEEPPTNFIDCKAWGYLAEAVGRFTKGDKVFVTGSLRSESWTDKETQAKRSKLVLVADLIVGMPTEGAPTTARPAAARPAPGRPAPKTEEADDIPF